MPAAPVFNIGDSSRPAALFKRRWLHNIRKTSASVTCLDHSCFKVLGYWVELFKLICNMIIKWSLNRNLLYMQVVIKFTPVWHKALNVVLYTQCRRNGLHWWDNYIQVHYKNSCWLPPDNIRPMIFIVWFMATRIKPGPCVCAAKIKPTVIHTKL